MWSDLRRLAFLHGPNLWIFHTCIVSLRIVSFRFGLLEPVWVRLARSPLLPARVPVGSRGPPQVADLPKQTVTCGGLCGRRWVGFASVRVVSSGDGGTPRARGPGQPLLRWLLPSVACIESRVIPGSSTDKDCHQDMSLPTPQRWRRRGWESEVGVVERRAWRARKLGGSCVAARVVDGSPRACWVEGSRSPAR